MTDHLVPQEVVFPPAGPVDRRLGHFVSAAGRRRFIAGYRAAAATLPTGAARSVETPFGRVGSYRFGAGPEESRTPLLLLPGRNASTPSWSTLLPTLLETGRAVYAVDGLGEAGCSVQTAPIKSPADQAAWVAHAIRALGLERVHLVGHSLGGWLAVQAGICRPDVVASLTVLDPPATLAPLGAGFVLAGLVASVPAVPSTLRFRLLRWIAGGGPADRPGSENQELQELGLTAVETFRVRQPAPRRPGLDELAAIAVPVLAVLGGRSRVHHAGAAARVATRAGWRTELWADASHQLHVEHPRRLLDLVRDFTDTVERGRPAMPGPVLEEKR